MEPFPYDYAINKPHSHVHLKTIRATGGSALALVNSPATKRLCCHAHTNPCTCLNHQHVCAAAAEAPQVRVGEVRQCAAASLPMTWCMMEAALQRPVCVSVCA